MDKEGLKTNRFLLALFCFAVIMVVLVGFSYFITFKGLPSQSMSKEIQELIGTWGTVGDYFGGTLNPILAFCSLMALCYTIDLQNKQLKKTDEQLKQNAKALEQNAQALELNNQELQNSNEQLRLSAQAQAEMEKTQRLQRFESLFTYMANELVKIYDDFKKDKSIKSEKFKEEWKYNEDNYKRNTIKDYHIFADLNYYFSEKPNKIQIDKIKKALRGDFKAVGFFMYLYQILKFIDNHNAINEEEKKFYSNLIRSSIENDVLQLVFLNCLYIKDYQEDFKYYNELVTKYNFFEHMTFSQNDKLLNTFVYLSSFYDKSAFGTSYYYQELLAKFLKTNYKSEHLLFVNSNHKSITIDVKNKNIYTEKDGIKCNFDLKNFEIINLEMFQKQEYQLDFFGIIFKVYGSDSNHAIFLKFFQHIHIPDTNINKNICVCLTSQNSPNPSLQNYIDFTWA